MADMQLPLLRTCAGIDVDVAFKHMRYQLQECVFACA